MRRVRNITIFVGSLFALFALFYIGPFIMWWLRCPRIEQQINDQWIEVVECEGRTAPLGSLQLWTPAFWFIDHLCGYRLVGFAPTDDGDAIFWTKTPSPQP